MSPRAHRPARAGFTIVEMLIAIAILVIIGAVAIPFFTGLNRRNDMTSVARKLAADVKNSKVLAASGRLVDPGPPAVKARSGGIHIIDQTTYATFVDGDTASGGEVDIDTVDLTREAPNAKIIEPVFPAFLRFRADGSYIGHPTVRIEDSEAGLKQKIEISGVGAVKVEPE